MLLPRMASIDLIPVEGHEHQHDDRGHQADDHQVLGRGLAALVPVDVLGPIGETTRAVLGRHLPVEQSV
jgi:hypothetical protein